MVVCNIIIIELCWNNDVLTSSLVLSPLDPLLGWSINNADNNVFVSFWANVILAFSCKPNISGVSLIGRPLM